MIASDSGTTLKQAENIIASIGATGEWLLNTGAKVVRYHRGGTNFGYWLKGYAEHGHDLAPWVALINSRRA